MSSRAQAAAPRVRSTTILCVRHQGKVALAGDGQVSFGDQVMKHTARKVRRMYNDTVIAG
ncbi:MAG: HslU--HslV peptidase proteolytic subunit, partial [candidate division NC10 bacterium]|nr:HslU--HslV peptidase proteolytic subunit [candidate division NC10 bacterium]